VDDTLLMKYPTTHEDNKLKYVLTNFCEASGTTSNLSKSQLFFFNTPSIVQHHISQLLGIPMSSLQSNYLGIPLYEGVTRNISWDALLSSLSNHLKQWTFRSLNIATRLVLIELILQAIPTNLFSFLVALQFGH
jgi:hypothetical protein